MIILDVSSARFAGVDAATDAKTPADTHRHQLPRPAARHASTGGATVLIPRFRMLSVYVQIVDERKF